MVFLRANLTILGTRISRGFPSIIRSMALFPLTMLFVLGLRWTTPFPLIALSHLSAIQKRQLFIQPRPPCIRVLQLTLIKPGVSAIGLLSIASLGVDIDEDVVGGAVARSFREITFYSTSRTRTVSRMRTVVSRPCRSSTRRPRLLLGRASRWGVGCGRSWASLLAHLCEASVPNSRGMARTCLIGPSPRFS